MSDQSSQERISQKLSADSAEQKKAPNKALRITAASVVAVGAVAGLLVFFGKAGESDTRNVVVTPDNVEEILADAADSKAGAGTYEVTMNTTWEFENGSSSSTNAYVENSVANSNDVYFDLVRSDTNEKIYSSPTIPIGNHLENITLDTPLAAGSYDCVLTYYLLDDKGEAVSKLNLKVVINVAH